MEVLEIEVFEDFEASYFVMFETVWELLADELGLDEILSVFEALEEIFVVLERVIGLEVFVETEEFETFKVLLIFDTLEFDDVFDILVKGFEGKEALDVFEDVAVFAGGDIIMIELLEIFVVPEGPYLVVVVVVVLF